MNNFIGQQVGYSSQIGLVLSLVEMEFGVPTRPGWFYLKFLKLNIHSEQSQFNLGAIGLETNQLSWFSG